MKIKTASDAKTAGIALLGLSCTLIAGLALMGDTELSGAIAFPCAVVLLIAACLLAAITAWVRSASLGVLGVYFFGAATAHALIGYLTAQPSGHMIWIPGSAGLYYGKSILLVAFGLLCSAIGYGMPQQSKPKAAVNDKKFVKTALIVGAFGIALILYVVATTGYLPVLQDSSEISSDRFLNADTSEDLLISDWILQRGMDLLTYTLPLFIIVAIEDRKLWAAGFAVLGAATLLIPARRANIVTVIVVVLLTLAKGLKFRMRHVLIAVPCLLLFYYTTQALFIGSTERHLDRDELLSVVGSGFPEIRDLGWMLAIKGDERLWGATLVQPLVPIPFFASDWKRTHNMGYVTIEAIGLGRVRKIGGLRLTLAGESYLNLDWPGIAVLGFGFGWLIAKVERGLQFSENRPLRYMHALFFTWLTCWIYLAGTQALGTIKVGLLTMGALYLVSRVRAPKAALQKVKAGLQRRPKWTGRRAGMENPSLPVAPLPDPQFHGLRMTGETKQ